MDIVDTIQNYLSNGGLFNPELMEHQKVSNMVIDARDEIESLRQQLAEQKKSIYDMENELYRHGKLAGEPAFNMPSKNK